MNNPTPAETIDTGLLSKSITDMANKGFSDEQITAQLWQTYENEPEALASIAYDMTLPGGGNLGELIDKLYSQSDSDSKKLPNPLNR